MMTKVDVILGLQWGDEGKGKIVDVLSPGYDIIARFQGGPNAGHTIIFNNRKYILHTIPSGIFRPSVLNVIGNGVIIDPFILFREIDRLHESGVEPEANLLISQRAHLILPTHRLLDAAQERSKGNARIGSTLKGIGPAYTDKYGRNGLRAGDIVSAGFRKKYEQVRAGHLESIRQLPVDLSDHRMDGLAFGEYETAWFEALERLKKLEIIDTEQFINAGLAAGKKILAEGAQGSLLDVDFGSYPYVTSSNTITAGVCSGLGISPHRVGTIYGVFKAYCTRVGSGPFPTELDNEEGERLRTGGNEFGSTTGRPRRCGWLDLPALNYAIMVNGVDRLVMMKADVLNPFGTIKVCTEYLDEKGPVAGMPFDLGAAGLRPAYREMTGWNSSLDGCTTADTLPAAMQEYVGFIERTTNLPVSMISTGPDREQTLMH